MFFDMTEEEYVEKRLDEIFAEHDLALPSKFSRRRSSRRQTKPVEHRLHQVAGGSVQKGGNNLTKRQSKVSAYSSSSRHLTGQQERSQRKRTVRQGHNQEVDAHVKADDGLSLPDCEVASAQD
jgi:hypothetical protein